MCFSNTLSCLTRLFSFRSIFVPPPTFPTRHCIWGQVLLIHYLQYLLTANGFSETNSILLENTLCDRDLVTYRVYQSFLRHAADSPEPNISAVPSGRIGLIIIVFYSLFSNDTFPLKYSSTMLKTAPTQKE